MIVIQANPVDWMTFQKAQLQAEEESRQAAKRRKEEEKQEMEERVKAREEQKTLEEVRAALEERLNIEMHCRLLEGNRLAEKTLAAEQARLKAQEATLDAERKCFEEENRLNAAREASVARMKQEEDVRVAKCIVW